MSSLAIIGTAGRGNDGFKLSKSHFDLMYNISNELISDFKSNNLNVDTLVSGGAAYADHVAVKLYLNNIIPNLILHLPCNFDLNEIIYKNAYYSKGLKNTATIENIINGYHRAFSRKVGFNSLLDIKLAIEKGAKTSISNSFKARNIKVASADMVLAMTFGQNEYVKPGGTSHTVSVYLDRVKKLGFFDKSFHFDLNTGEIYFGAKIKE
jgi:hypothetical protein